MNKEFEVFKGGWPGDETVCGWGSMLEHTTDMRMMLPYLIEKYGITSINDAGCGDLNWIKHTDLKGASYIGYDLFERESWVELREQGWKLRTLDITEKYMAPAIMAMVRDVFIHLPNTDILKALDKIRRTHVLLLASTFVSMSAAPFSNEDRIQNVSMHHSKLDLSAAPFNLGEPIARIHEDYPHKYTALWNLHNVSKI